MLPLHFAGPYLSLLIATYKDPSRVTILDRWGSSRTSPKVAAAIDVNRIIRTDYVNPLYCNLANEAIHPWFWDIDLGHFFHKTGWVVLDEKGNEFTKNVRQTFRQRGSDYTKETDVNDLSKRWGILNGMKRDDLGDAYFNPEAGWCDAAAATERFMAVAEKKGVKRVTAEVLELVFDPEKKQIAGAQTTDGRVWTADKIVLASGAWTSRLLAPVEDALRLEEHDRVERQIKAVGRISAYYTLSPRETDLLQDMPVLVYGGRGILTPPSRENRTLKINDLATEFVNTIRRESGHQISVPSARHQEDVPERLKSESEALLGKMMPGFAADRKPDRWRICWDAATPTGDWLLCKHPHPQLQNLHLVVGGNFSSYKFMPIAGKYSEIMADSGFTFVVSNGPKLQADPQVRAVIRKHAMKRVAMTRKRRVDRSPATTEKIVPSTKPPMQHVVDSSSGGPCLIYPSDHSNCETAENDDSIFACWSPSTNNDAWHQPEDAAGTELILPAQPPGTPYEAARSWFQVDLNDFAMLTNFNVGPGSMSLLSAEPRRLLTLLGQPQWSYMQFVPSRYGASRCLTTAVDCVLAKLRGVPWVTGDHPRAQRSCVHRNYCLFMRSLALPSPRLGQIIYRGRRGLYSIERLNTSKKASTKPCSLPMSVLSLWKQSTKPNDSTT
ncbi:L-pipecolate oxidase [Colletotrichum orbiculare MAFF 240422]|uniref:L-pipecolate oxidase n=1 Tax=Colletotrichum orbiculare (strain 104-T / ATCC 96160 / CBS 514.97 / LARS 414 / MAFF 240422) TaxID=1213857 RepID=A0A484FFL9_COLOR|nr:L-pipecolate oxidase [Colletotrichum orbiculare MAFF 240422]